jgi:hypothetical protein
VSWFKIAERTGAVGLLLSTENPVELLTDIPPCFPLLVEKNPGYIGMLLIISILETRVLVYKHLPVLKSSEI